MSHFIKQDKLYVPIYSDSPIEKKPVFTQHVKTIAELHPQVKKWADAAKNYSKVNPSISTLHALDTFWKSLSDTLKSKLLAVYPFVPDYIDAAVIPLYNVANLELSIFNAGFSNDDLNRNGLKGNGASKYIDSNLSTDSFNQNISSSLLVTELPIGNDKAYFGLVNLHNEADRYALIHYHSGVSVWHHFGDDSVQFTCNKPAFISVNINPQNNAKRVETGLGETFGDYVINQGSSPMSSSPEWSTIVLFAERFYNEDGSAYEEFRKHSNARLGFFAFHNFLTPALSLELAIAVSILRKNLGGTVY